MSVYHSLLAVYICRSNGEKKGPSKLPRVDCTTVKAVLPCACRVMTMLEEMVVGTQPVKIIPTSSPGSMNFGFVAHRLTIPYMTAEVMRNDCICTKRWIFHRL